MQVLLIHGGSESPPGDRNQSDNYFTTMTKYEARIGKKQAKDGGERQVVDSVSNKEYNWFLMKYHARRNPKVPEPLNRTIGEWMLSPPQTKSFQSAE